MELHTNTTLTLYPATPRITLQRLIVKYEPIKMTGAGRRRGGERTRKEIENQYNHKHNQAAFKKFLSLIKKNLSRYNEI